MLTGDKILDGINEALAVAFAAWQAEPNAATSAALAQVEANKADHLSKTLTKARADYMQRFLQRLQQ